MPRYCAVCVYPQFEILHNETQRFVSAKEAARLLNDGGILGETVRESDNTTRPITSEEQKEIYAAKEEWAEA